MTTAHVLFLRGINVGGHNKLPMADLRTALARAGCTGVKTYIQSGNGVFMAPPDAALASRISAEIKARTGLTPPVFLMTQAQFQAAIAQNPYPVDPPNLLHLVFLDRPVTDTETARITAAQTGADTVHFADRMLYLHTPEGFGRSKLAEAVSRLKAGTARNWRTVTKMAEMLEDMAP